MKNKIFALYIIGAVLLFYACNGKQENQQTTATQEASNELPKGVKEFINESMLLKYRYLTSIDKNSIDALVESLKTKYESDKALAESMSEFEYIKKMTSETALKYTAADVVTHIDSFTNNPPYINFLVTVKYALHTNAKDLKADTNIISCGAKVMEIKILNKDSVYLIISEKLQIIPRDTTTFEKSGAFPASPVSIFSYNPIRASTWAYQHYSDAPTTAGYHDFTNSGGDCTNFLSHCLKQGGWVMENYWFYRTASTPVCDNMADANCKRSPGWTGAAKFNEYITIQTGKKRVTSKFATPPKSPLSAAELTTISQMEVGDIIQLKDDDNGVHHSMIVTQKTSGTPYIFVAYRNEGSNHIERNQAINLISAGQEFYGYAVKP